MNKNILLLGSFLFFYLISCQPATNTKHVESQGSENNPAVNKVDSLPTKKIKKVTNIFDTKSDEPRGSVANKIINDRTYFYTAARFRYDDPSGKWYIYERPKGVHTYRYSDETMDRDIKAFKVEIYDEEDSIIKSIDLEETNPYANKRDPKYIGEGRPGFQERAYSNQAHGSTQELLEISDEYYSIAEIRESSTDYFIIDYGIVARKSLSQYIGEAHTWIVLDIKGKELGRVDNLLGWVRNGILSKDKELLFFLIGDYQSFEKQRLMIFDLQKNEYIYDSDHLEESYTTQTEIGFEKEEPHWISVGVEIDPNNDVRKIKKYIHVDTRTIFTRKFTEKEWTEVKQHYATTRTYSPEWLITKYNFTTEKF